MLPKLCYPCSKLRLKTHARNKLQILNRKFEHFTFIVKGQRDKAFLQEKLTYLVPRVFSISNMAS